MSIKTRGWHPICILTFLLIFSYGLLAQLKKETLDAFDNCMTEVEAKITQKQSSAKDFLSISEGQPDYKKVVADNGVAIRHIKDCSVPDGLAHHWLADTFIKGATVPQVLKVLNDVDRFPTVYSPRVISAKCVSSSGNKHTVEMVLQDSKAGVTVAFDGTYEVTQGELDPQHVYSDSRSVQVKIVKPQGKDYGIPWRLNTYWRLVQVPAGVIAECETISVTRDAPVLIAWLIRPFVTDIPQQSLQFTLESTKKAALASKANDSHCVSVQGRGAQ